MITITPFEEFYTQDVIDLVLHFQNDGTRPIVTVEDQPDLLHITDAYFRIAAVSGSPETEKNLPAPSALCPAETASLC